LTFDQIFDGGIEVVGMDARARWFRLLVLVLGLALLAAACGGGGGDTAGGEATPGDAPEPSAPAGDEATSEASEPAAATPAETRQVNYLTSFSTFGRDAYVYVADELGYFDEAGLEVTVNPGTGTVDVMRLIAAGTADFGPADGATAAITIANQGLPVRAVAAIQQQSLAALVTLESSGITEPADLEGKTFSDAPASTVRILFPFYAAAAGFDDEAVEFVPGTPPDLPRLLASGQVDVIGQFVVGRGLIESATQQPAVFFPYSEYLPDLYGNLIVARTEMIEQEPEVVERFIGALLRGLEYSIENPEETGAILARYVPEQNPQAAAGEVEIMAPFVRPEGFDEPIGTIDEQRVQAMLDLLEEAGALENEITVDDVVSTEFVPEG
jgi:NitT/TauT family transport system substrate-binding protein